MFILRKPADAQIKTFIESQQLCDFSYREVGATRETLPSGYQVDHNRIRLGEGKEIYQNAITALKQWKHFNLGWVSLRPANAPIAAGSVVAVLVNHLAFWSLNA